MRDLIPTELIPMPDQAATDGQPVTATSTTTTTTTATGKPKKDLPHPYL